MKLGKSSFEKENAHQSSKLTGEVHTSSVSSRLEEGGLDTLHLSRQLRVSFAFRHGDGESLPCLLKCGFFSKKSCQIASRNRVNSAHATLYMLFFFVGFHLSLSSLPFVFSSRTRATDGAPQDTVFLLWCLETRKSSLVHRTSDGMWTRGLTHGQHALTRF